MAVLQETVMRYRAQLAEVVLDTVFEARRLWISQGAVRGEGLEIGALHRPLRVRPGTRVRYVDRLGVADLRHQYPELRDKPLVAVDVIDNGETLLSQADDSQDFIIANHFLEHTEDPIGTIKSHLRVLRPGGHLYIAIPMKDATFDSMRDVTSIDHLVRDHLDGPATSRSTHFEEWVQLVDRVPIDEVPKRAKQLQDCGYSIHFHVWNEAAFIGFMMYLERDRNLGLQVIRTRRNRHELIVIVQKTDGAMGITSAASTASTTGSSPSA